MWNALFRNVRSPEWRTQQSRFSDDQAGESPEKKTHRSTVPGLGDQTEIGRKSTGVSGPGSLIVGIRSWHVIRKLSRPLEFLPFVIWTILIFDLLSHGLDLIHCVRNSNEITPGDSIEGMAGRADFAVDLVTSSDAIPQIRGVWVRWDCSLCDGGWMGESPTYAAWSKVSKGPRKVHGYCGGWRPSSAGVIALTS